MYIYIYIYTHTYTYVCIYIYICIYICVCVCVCVCVCCVVCVYGRVTLRLLVPSRGRVDHYAHGGGSASSRLLCRRMLTHATHDASCGRPRLRPAGLAISQARLCLVERYRACATREIPVHCGCCVSVCSVWPRGEPEIEHYGSWFADAARGRPQPQRAARACVYSYFARRDGDTHATATQTARDIKASRKRPHGYVTRVTCVTF